MVKPTIDFESRSPIDLLKCGSYVYAEHPDTEVLMLAVKVGDGPTRLWIPREFRHLMDTEISDKELAQIIEGSDVLSAHNAGQFERIMWERHMLKRGFPETPLEKWDDTAARAAMCSLPRKLEKVTAALGMSVHKDAEGHKSMMRMTNPRPLRKAERLALAQEIGWTEELVKKAGKDILDDLKVDPLAPGYLPANYHRFFAWVEDEATFRRVAEYCRQDVETEYALGLELPELPEAEKKVYILDQIINDRGIQVDSEMAAHARAMIEDHEKTLTGELLAITEGAVPTAKSLDKMTAWLADQGVRTDSLDKETVADLLKAELPPDARRVLEIRQALAMSSVSKLDALRSCTCRDGRIRGWSMYHGAGTGRWTGKGFQPHNLPRGDETMDQDAAMDNLFPLRDVELLGDIWGNPLNAISSCLRGMLRAAPGKKLIPCDYSAIEGRVLAWLAGEEHVIQAYQDGKDLYKVAASGVYRIPYEQVDGGGKGKQRQIGKICELALGYQGGSNAMLQFGADKKGLSEEEIEEAVKNWRAARPATVRLWKKLEEAAVKCVKERVNTKYRDIRFRREGKFLVMILPGGRRLYYYSPQVKSEIRFGKPQDVLSAWTVDSKTKQWVRRSYYGGLWAENATQATARDILVHGMFQAEEEGYPVVLHVHDEIVPEVDADFGSAPELEEIICRLPAWAEGLPMKAAGFESVRYKKD